jgi:hypothetical protein
MSAADQAALGRPAMLLDFTVAEEMHVADRYQTIKEVIDSHINPDMDGGQETKISKAEQQRYEAEWKHDEKVIAPYRKELEALSQEYMMGMFGGAQKPDST